MKLSHVLFAGFMIALVYFGGRFYLQQKEAENNQRETRNRVEKGFLKTKKEFNDKLEDIRQRKEEVIIQIARLDERLKTASEKLKGLGVANPADLEKNEVAQLEFRNASRLMNDIRKYRGDIETFDKAIVRIEAALDEIDRQELRNNAGISEEQALQLETIIKDVDDRLLAPQSPVDELKTQEILDELLGK